jgi:hypothetical protein
MFHDEAMKARHGKWHDMSAGKKALMIGGGAVAFAAFLALASFVVMLLWNWIMASVLGLPRFGFWEAFGILALSKILFGGKGQSMMGRMRMRRVMRERMAARAEGEEEKLD